MQYSSNQEEAWDQVQVNYIVRHYNKRAPMLPVELEIQTQGNIATLQDQPPATLPVPH